MLFVFIAARQITIYNFLLGACDLMFVNNYAAASC